MNKKHIKNLTFILLVLVLTACLALSLYACNKNTTTTDTDSSESEKSSDTEKATDILKNGTFETYSGSSAPYSATNWTGTSSNTSANTVAGVIHTGDLYNTESANSAWAGIADPGKAKESDKDTAIYMIYNSDANIYTVSSSFSTVAGAYYKATVDFKSIGNSQGAQGGAFITFQNAAYHKFGPFLPSTDGWKTVTLYLESSLLESKTVDVKLSLGDPQGDNAVGVAFFDNVVVEKITKAEYDEFTVSNSTLEAKYSMLLADGDFINNKGTSNPTASNIWSESIGKDEESNSTAITTYTKHGVVNVDKFSEWKDYVGDKEDETVLTPGTPYDANKDNLDDFDYDLSPDRNILMITSYPAISHVTSADNTKNAYTAIGYSNDLKIAIELGSYYELKVWVMTNLINYEYPTADENDDDDKGEASDINNSGAWLKLTGLSSDAVIKNIDTQGVWKEYTFAIVGHEYRTKAINLEMWLGQGGRDGNELACGTVYFDNVRLIKKGTFTEQTRNDILNNYKTNTLYNPAYTCVVDVSSISGANLTENNDISNPNFTEVTEENRPTGWSLSLSEGVNGQVSYANADDIQNSDVIVRLIDTKAAEALLAQEVTKDGKTDEEYEKAVKEWWLAKYGIEADPKAPTDALNPVLMINNSVASAYTLALDNDINIVKNLHYRLALWVKTMGIESGKGATISLLNKSNDNASLSSFTNVNTSSYENETTNGYAEYVFYIKGSNFVSVNGADDDKLLNLTVTLGSGSAFNPSSFIKGALFIANVNLEQISYQEYNAVTTGTYVKTASLTSTLGTVSNGSFNSYSYDDKKFDTGTETTVGTGYQTDYLEPSNWSKNSALDSSVKSGIVNINSTDFVASEFGANYVFYNEWDNGISNGKPIDFGAPNLLAIKVPTAIKAQLAYKTSSTISLSANKYYVIKGYARSVDGLVGEISVSASNNSKPLVQKITSSVNDGWQEFVFAFETGAISSTSATVNIYIGNYSVDNVTTYEEGEEPLYSGTLFLDSFTYYEVTKAQSEEIAKDGNFISYTVDTFSTTSDSTKVSSPSGWTGSGEKISGSTASTDNTQYAGIFTQTYGDESIFKLVKEETTEEDGESKTSTVTIDGSTLTKTQIFDSNGMVDQTVGDGVLVINNQVASYANYKNSSSLTFNKASYYKVSVYARTVGIEQGKFASVRVETGSDAVKYEIPVNTEYTQGKDADGKVTYTANTENKWQLYTFYVKTAESTNTSSVHLYLTLGTTDDKIQGYAFFDNVSIVALEDSTEFDQAYALRYKVDSTGKAVVDENGQYVSADTADEFLLNNRIIRADDKEDDAKEEDNTNPEDNTPQTSSDLLWLYITSIVIAVLLLAVIVVYFVRKYMPKKALKKNASNKDVDYARQDQQEIKSDDSKKDEFKD